MAFERNSSQLQRLSKGINHSSKRATDTFTVSFAMLIGELIVPAAGCQLGCSGNANYNAAAGATSRISRSIRMTVEDIINISPACFINLSVAAPNVTSTCIAGAKATDTPSIVMGGIYLALSRRDIFYSNKCPRSEDRRKIRKLEGHLSIRQRHQRNRGLLHRRSYVGCVPRPQGRSCPHLEGGMSGVRCEGGGISVLALLVGKAQFVNPGAKGRNGDVLRDWIPVALSSSKTSYTSGTLGVDRAC
ncbi:hypothetical protein BGW80DRAFT_1495072 [Lactifluus volemus]|nr:hypothetical protein BGW80DRAFT_1495072 [Lactifluus volemus]